MIVYLFLKTIYWIGYLTGKRETRRILRGSRRY